MVNLPYLLATTPCPFVSTQICQSHTPIDNLTLAIWMSNWNKPTKYWSLNCCICSPSSYLFETYPLINQHTLLNVIGSFSSCFWLLQCWVAVNFIWYDWCLFDCFLCYHHLIYIYISGLGYQVTEIETRSSRACRLGNNSPSNSQSW